MSPDRLFQSFKREVIQRNPQAFKIVALRDVRHLFPTDHNPFYAGFGNRNTDVVAYSAVGVPTSKIYIINPYGKIGIGLGPHSNYNYEKSYPELNEMVEEMFPPHDALPQLHKATTGESETNTELSLGDKPEYSTASFWRDPIPDLPDLDNLDGPTPITATTSTPTASSSSLTTTTTTVASILSTTSSTTTTTSTVGTATTTVTTNATTLTATMVESEVLETLDLEVGHQT